LGVATLDAALLGTDPLVVAELLRGTIDGATLVRIEGAWPDHLTDDVRGVLGAAPAVTIAVDAPPEVGADPFDLSVPDAAAASALEAAFRRAPLAGVAGALLLRGAPRALFDGLVAESATYSMLQAGPEFRAWRAARPTRAPGRPDAAEPRVRVEEHPGVREIVLVRTGRHNALDVPMRDALHDALLDAARSPTPVVLRGDGPSFCSGGDLDEFGTFPDPVLAHLVRLDRSLALAVAALADRLVVALHGSCLGAGIELPAFARIVLAADDARLGLPEQAIGLVPGAGGTVSIARRSGRHAVLDLLLRDGTVDAEHGRTTGMVDEVVPFAALRDRAFEAAAGLA